MNGSYENLKGGSSSEAMEDFSGGVTEMFDLTETPPQNLFNIINKAVERESMMGCSVDVSHIHYTRDHVSMHYSLIMSFIHS